RNSEPITNPSRGIGDSPSDNPCPLSKLTGLCAAYFWKTSPVTPILDLLNTLAKGYSMMETTWEGSGMKSTLETRLIASDESQIQGNTHAVSAHQRGAIPGHRLTAFQAGV
ncbi:MAG: hypothetical protein ABSG91_17205, partial [Syntrophobacteraceae bacterium]